MTAIRIAAGLALALVGAGCLGPRPGLFPPKSGAAVKSLYVVSHDRHAALVLARSDLPIGLIPEARDFPAAEYLEIGWGEKDYYRTPQKTSGLAFKALCWPNPSVLHVVGFSGPVTAYFPTGEVARVELSARGYEELCAWVDLQFERGDGWRGAALERGRYGDSWFYPATGKYCGLNTCNVWTAHALRAAGCPITPASSLTANRVMRQTRRFGTIIRQR
jgi:uncharacterized protein (TIGR02117 family)